MEQKLRKTLMIHLEVWEDRSSKNFLLVERRKMYREYVCLFVCSACFGFLFLFIFSWGRTTVNLVVIFPSVRICTIFQMMMLTPMTVVNLSKGKKVFQWTQLCLVSWMATRTAVSKVYCSTQQTGHVTVEFFRSYINVDI